MRDETMTARIAELKKTRDAVILAHNYQLGEVQDVADFTGDSLELSLKAASAPGRTIVFCGVHFMAETAAILCPDKTVLLPDENAGCPMANMITARELREEKARRPGAVVVAYVNTTAAVKAESDICCTSSNAVRVVESVPKDREIIFVPDVSLGRWVEIKTGRKMALWKGYCPTHHRILPRDVEDMRRKHPAAEVVVHPECIEEVVLSADWVGSTTGILRHCAESAAKEFLIGTEIGILHRLRKENPEKAFFPLTELADCPNMKLNSLEKIIWALEDMAPAVTVPVEVAGRARKAIEAMFKVK